MLKKIVIIPYLNQGSKGDTHPKSIVNRAVYISPLINTFRFPNRNAIGLDMMIPTRGFTIPRILNISKVILTVVSGFIAYPTAEIKACSVSTKRE